VTSVRVTALAVAEIDAIADFIARTSSVERAAAFLAYGRIDALAIFPMSGLPRPRAGARVRSVWSKGPVPNQLQLKLLRLKVKEVSGYHCTVILPMIL